MTLWPRPMKTPLLQAAILALCSSHALPVQAGSVEGTIASLVIRDSDGLVYVHVNGANGGRPACAQNQPYWMIKDENSVTGKRLIGTLLAAQLIQRRVTIWGYGTCTRWGDGEDIHTVFLQ